MTNSLPPSSALVAYIDGIGLCGPGLLDWPAARAVLRGEAAYRHQPTVLTAPASLPSAERRRCGPIVKLSLTVGHAAAAAAELDVSTLPTVFAASGGDGSNCHEICAMLASDDRQISPTRFHNSVHNAAAGYWSIAAAALAPSSVVCAFDASFGAGLLEAVTQTVVDRRASLLIACDTSYPEPLRSARPIPDEFGVGLALAPQRGPRSLARIAVTLCVQQSDLMPDHAMEQLRSAIPAARCLPILQAIAQGKPAATVIAYLHNVRLAVEVTPCC
jgi:hypothetical protein